VDSPRGEGSPDVPEIVRDEGPANSGGASKTQRVVIRRLNGTEQAVHAKFAKTTAGQDAAEGGYRGLASELLAGLLAEAMGASAPRTEIVLLPDDMDITLRDGSKAAPGKAVASHTVESSVDVPSADAIQDVPIEDVARISALESWTEMGDRNHNMIKSGHKPYSIDHASGFASSWQGADPPGNLVTNELTRERLAGDSSARAGAGEALAAVPDEAIDSAVDAIPSEWMDLAEKTRFKKNLKKSRDAVANKLQEGTA
jgi:hypothetical protein